MKQSIDTKPHLIYKLIDPRDGEVRYVGQTNRTLEKRLNSHLRTKENNHRGYWIREVLRDDYVPIIAEIETVPAGEDWANREMLWIAIYRGWGCRLVNATDGGEGCVGYVWSEESREKARRSQLGCKQSPEHIEKTRQGKRKPVARYTRAGKFIDKWDSAKTAGEALGIPPSNITTCARGERLMAGGFIWRRWKETLGTDIEPYVYPRSIPVARYTLENVFVDRWESATKAGMELNINSRNIRRCAIGRDEGKDLSAYGFIWKFVV